MSRAVLLPGQLPGAPCALRLPMWTPAPHQLQIPPAGRRQRASSDATKNLKRLQTQRFRGGTRNHRSAAGRTACVRVAQD